MKVQTYSFNRNFVVLGAILIQLCLGAIYSWSVYTPILSQNGWSKGDTQIVFAAGLASFALFMVLAGRLLPKYGPRALSILGGSVLSLGYILGGAFDPFNFWSTFFFVGIIGGAGIGLAYVVPIAVGMKWFPDKKGLVTGLAVAGFGFGATIWVKLAGSWGNLLETVGINNTFIIYGVSYFILVALGGIFMVFPAKDWAPPGFCEIKEKKELNRPQFNSKEMLKTPQFHMISLTFMCGASAGLMSIGLMKLFPMKALMNSGVSELEASAIAGTAMAIFFSLANGLGRILWGVFSDYLGRKESIVLMMVVQGAMVILFQWMASNEYLLYLAATFIGLNFGGNFALFPTITADTFGTKYIGQNYGWVFLAYGFGGIFGPTLGGVLGDLNNFPLAFIICGGLCFLAALIISFLKSPRKEIQKDLRRTSVTLKTS